MREKSKCSKIVSICLIFIGCSLVAGLGALIDSIYPNSQGFCRSVLYIPNEEAGYYIIDDHIQTDNNKQSDLYFYGLGDRIISEQSVSWQIDDIKLNLTILFPSVTITPVNGTVYRTEDINQTSYGVKITPETSGDLRVVSLFMPYNITNLQSLTIEEVTEDHPELTNFKLWKINETDILAMCMGGEEIKQDVGTQQQLSLNIGDFEYDGIKSRTNRLFYRKNSTNAPILIQSYGKSMEYKNLTYSIANSADNTLSTFGWSENPTQLLQAFANDDELGINEKKQTMSSSPPDTSNLEHPFLFYNQSHVNDLRNKIDGTISGPWKNWYDNIGPSWTSVASRAFKAYIEADDTLMDAIIEELLTMPETYEPFRQNLHRGSLISDYVVAYDILYNNMSIEERAEFENEAFSLTYPAAESIINNVCPNNNHKIVSLNAYGMLGLMLNNRSMIQLMQDQIDNYLNNLNQRGGIGFEGPSYSRYTYKYASRFMYALKQCGGYDYFNDPNFIDVLNYSIYERAPDGTHPLFEDAHEGIDLSGLIITSITQVENQYPNLAANMRWYVNQYDPNYATYNGLFYNVIMYNSTGTAVKPQTQFSGSYAFFEGGMAGLGTGQDSNDTMLVISNKEYYTSHAHYDENSIELWAFGKKFLTNAGYPHYGSTAHAMTVKTKSNNAIMVGGDSQYLIKSDGFSSFTHIDGLTSIESPCFLAYEHALSLSHFPWYSILGLIAIFYVGLVLLKYFEFKSSKNRVDSCQRNVLRTYFHKLEQISRDKIDKSTRECLINILKFISLLSAFATFTAILWRSYTYLSIGIAHLELYPEVKMQFHTLLLYTLIVSTILHALLLCLNYVRKRGFLDTAFMFRKMNQDNTEFWTQSYQRSITISFISAIWMLIVLIMSQTMFFNGFIELQENFFTEGSTTQNFFTQFLVFVEILWTGYFILIIIRYILIFAYTKSKKYISYYLKRDLWMILIISLILIGGIYFAQNISIAALQNF